MIENRWYNVTFKNLKEMNKSWERKIGRLGGRMPYFIEECISSKVSFEIIKKYADKFKKSKILVYTASLSALAVRLSYLFEVDFVETNKLNLKMDRKLVRFYHSPINFVDKIKKKYDIIFVPLQYENFNKKDAIKLMKKHLSKTEYLIFVVPVKPILLYKAYNLREWKKIIKKAGADIIEIYGIGYSRVFRIVDYILRLNKLFQSLSKFKLIIIKKSN